MNAEMRARLLSGLRRGAAAGALSGGLTLMALAFVWAGSLTMGVGASTTVLVGMPIAVSMGWTVGLMLGLVCGVGGGALRAWSRQRLPSVMAGALIGYLVCWCVLWLVQTSLFQGRFGRIENKVWEVALVLGSFGIIPGACGGFWGDPNGATRSGR